jgi:hypothetical protein
VTARECYPVAPQKAALEQRQADWGKAAAATKTRLVNPDETSLAGIKPLRPAKSGGHMTWSEPQIGHIASITRWGQRQGWRSN